MTSINLDGVDAWKGGGLLPAGTHTVEIADATEKTSSNGNPQVEIELRAVGGECDGGTIRDWITLTAEAFGRVRQFLEAVRYTVPEGTFEMPVNELVGKQCVIVIREEPYDGQMKSKVKAYEQTKGDIPAAVGASNSKSDDLPF